jgi:hypothetical protein
MTEAKSMKLKEYGTELLVHDPSGRQENSRLRMSNTFKSSVMEQMP